MRHVGVNPLRHICCIALEAARGRAFELRQYFIAHQPAWWLGPVDVVRVAGPLMLFQVLFAYFEMNKAGQRQQIVFWLYKYRLIAPAEQRARTLSQALIVLGV